MKVNILTVFILSVIMIACKGTENSHSSAQGKVEYEKLAEQKLGSDVEFIKSPDEAYMLCFVEKKGTAQQPENSVKFFVYRFNDKSVVYEETVSRGSVKWTDDSKLELFYLPGAMPVDKTRDDFVYIYDLETGTKTNKSGVKN